MKDFALVVAYYENPSMLRTHFATLEDSWVADHVEFVVTDDGSEKAPARPDPNALIPHKVFRILGPKVPWGHNLCRNVGCENSTAPWVLVTDIDHTVPVETWRALYDKLDTLKKDRPHRLSRVNAPDLDEYHRHPDTWFMHRSFYEKMGGFDEAGRGAYGQNSLIIQAAVRAAGLKSEDEIEVLPEYVIRYSRDVLPDASTTQFERKSKENKEAMKRIRADKAARGKTGIPERLGVPYERVMA